MAIPFKSFEDAVRDLPRFLIGGLDVIGQHHTISDLKFMVQHEIDLYVEGDFSSIVCRRGCDTSARYQRCKAFIARCDAEGGQK